MNTFINIHKPHLLSAKHTYKLSPESICLLQHCNQRNDDLWNDQDDLNDLNGNDFDYLNDLNDFNDLDDFTTPYLDDMMT